MISKSMDTCVTLLALPAALHTVHNRTTPSLNASCSEALSDWGAAGVDGCGSATLVGSVAHAALGNKNSRRAAKARRRKQCPQDVSKRREPTLLLYPPVLNRTTPCSVTVVVDARHRATNELLTSVYETALRAEHRSPGHLACAT